MCGVWYLKLKLVLSRELGHIKQDFQKMRHLISKQTTLILEHVALILLPSDIDFYYKYFCIISYL